MPLFKRQSNSAKKRLQHQQYLARESPEPTFDISHCEISEIPSGTFSLCKVLHKTALVAHHNWLSSLKGGENLKDLAGLRILDVHNNEICALPDDIQKLERLQVLNLENNKLKHLPTSIGQLSYLQTLNLKGNKLQELPESICGMRSLRTLDIRNNHIARLPRGLCNVRTLETLLLDASHMHYPPADICSQGTDSIAKFLCTECGMTYEPPSKFLLDVLDGMSSAGSSGPASPAYDVSPLNDTIMSYEKMKERKRQQQIQLEKQLEEDQLAQTQLAMHAANNKQHLVKFLAEDQQRINSELSSLQLQRDAQHRLMVETMCQAEKNAEKLMNGMMKANEKAKKTEALLEKMEKERMVAEQWFIVHQGEVENLRRKDIMRNMQVILEENKGLEQLVSQYMQGRESSVKQMQASANDMDDRLNSVLNIKDQAQRNLVSELLVNEEMQREAFEALQLSKDAQHQRLSGQIGMIEQELAQLTMLEIEQRQLKLQNTQDVLQQKRQMLIDMLQQLMKERDARAKELHQRMLEMEQRKLDEQTDYWLVQYQRLMDRKPQALMDVERKLEIAVVEILERAGAMEYTPAFARHRISIETMLTLSDGDLQQIGVSELGLRKAILAAVLSYKLHKEEEQAAAKLKLLENPKDWKAMLPLPGAPAREVEPSAPTLSPSASAASSPDKTSTIRARGINTECVICMAETTEVLFLGCGHVCCCHKCSEKVSDCPLCRGTIEQRILLAV